MAQLRRTAPLPQWSQTSWQSPYGGDMGVPAPPQVNLESSGAILPQSAPGENRFRAFRSQERLTPTLPGQPGSPDLPQPTEHREKAIAGTVQAALAPKVNAEAASTRLPEPPPTVSKAGAEATPARPSEPTPTASLTPQPFTPMPAPAPEALVQAPEKIWGTAGGLLGGGYTPAPEALAQAPGKLRGAAGGLLGGGYSARSNGGPGRQDPTALLLALLQALG